MLLREALKNAQEIGANDRAIVKAINLTMAGGPGLSFNAQGIHTKYAVATGDCDNEVSHKIKAILRPVFKDDDKIAPTMGCGG